MIAPFIPYFIAANLATDTSSWSNGPEYMFTMLAHMQISTNVDISDTINMTVVLAIRCQPKANDSLKCVSKRVSATVIAPDRVSNKVSDDENEVYFEMKFKQNGIVDLSLNESVREAELAAFKRVASMFSVGVDLSNPAVTSAEGTTENSVLGECENTVVNVKTGEPSGNPEHLDEYRYDLYPIPLNRNAHRMNMELTKTRNPSKCSAKDLFYFFIGAPAVDVKSSVSKIVVTDMGQFDSTTTTRSKFAVPDRDEKVVSIIEHLHLSLSAVKQATEIIPSVPNLRTVSIAIIFEEIESFYE